jgi:hypothetical protein
MPSTDLSDYAQQCIWPTRNWEIQHINITNKDIRNSYPNDWFTTCWCTSSLLSSTCQKSHSGFLSIPAYISILAACTALKDWLRKKKSCLSCHVTEWMNGCPFLPVATYPPYRSSLQHGLHPLSPWYSSIPLKSCLTQVGAFGNVCLKV